MINSKVSDCAFKMFKIKLSLHILFAFGVLGKEFEDHEHTVKPV